MQIHSNNMAKVSVIVPVYGVEKYIERCARSLFEQTLDDIEYLFIDDCTQDKSIEILESILEEYPKRKAQVIFHRMPHNSGQAKVREWGICNATGDYVIHCDSDDWVDKEMYRLMYEKAKNEGADIVVCDYVQNDGNGNTHRFIGCHEIDTMTFLINCFYQIDSWAVWNKLCLRSLYTGIKYPIEAMGEDMVLTMQLLMNCKSVAYVSFPLYNYYINPESITKQPTIERCMRNYNQIKKNTGIIINLLSYENGNTMNLSFVIPYLKYNVMTMLLPLVGKRCYYNIWKNTYENFSKDFLLEKKIPLIYKIRYLLTLIHLYPQKKNRML